MNKILGMVLVLTQICLVSAQSKHGNTSRYTSTKGLIMAGYQGWFRAPGDGSGEVWGHYGTKGRFDDEHTTIDFWPDVREYEKTYETSFLNADGTPARVFSSVDKSTTDLHFKWMKEYGVDGVFMQRFFGVARQYTNHKKSHDVILKNAIEAAQTNDRAIALMYDLSGLKATGEDCSVIIEDWKMLVDKHKLTNQGEEQSYLYHNGKPLVAIWGVGFPDRPYNIRNIGLNRLIDFLKNDPVYGGCSVLLGVPTYFRDLDKDCVKDPYLHELIESADIVLPWMVQRFTPLVHKHKQHLLDHVLADLKWSKDKGVDYMPIAYPGFSWSNLAKVEKGVADYTIYGAIPRMGGRFYWDQLCTYIAAGTSMIYVAMFDEIDEGTAIMKVSDTPPNSNKTQFVDNDGRPSDHYLWLTGKAAKMLRKEEPLMEIMPEK
jgi:hypothetical protein